MYSIIQFISEMMLYRIDSMIGDWQFLYIDAFVIAPISFLMSLTGPSKSLTLLRPTTSLKAPTILLSIIGQSLIQAFFLSFAWWFLTLQPWYEPLKPDKQSENTLSYETTTLFLLTTYQYIFVVIAFSIPKNHLENLYILILYF